MDNHTLNKWTVCDTYSIPLIGNILNHLHGKNMFNKLVAVQQPIKEDNQWKAAFKTPFGLYELMVMYLSLTNSSATFCCTMKKNAAPHSE